jgi:hypothetical protein
MSNYSKITDFAAKDALSTGNPAKIVKGTEIDDELVAISGAIASKSNTAAPTFTGTTTVADLAASGAATVGGAFTVSGASVMQAVTATAVVADTLTLDSGIVFEGATEDAYETTLTITDPTADRTITFPDKTGTVALISDIDTATISSVSGTYSVSSSTAITISITAHGRTAGDLVYLNFTSGTAVSSEFTVTSVLNANSYTVTNGTSITASGNVTQYFSALGQVRLASFAEILEGTNTTKAITPYAYQTSKFGGVTAVATTSGTAVDFTGIPLWVKRVTVIFSGLSTTGTSIPMIQVGSGSVTSSNYVAGAILNSSSNTTATSTAGFIQSGTSSAAAVYQGQCVLTLVGSNTWVSTSTQHIGGGQCATGAGNVTLGGALDRVRITTVNGTTTFDAGSVNILYE